MIDLNLSNRPRACDLLAEARGGSADCLGKLLQSYQHYLRLLATTQLDQKLQARLSPSDIVQETMLDAFRDFPDFRGESEQELLAWLRQILIHNMHRIVQKHVLARKRDIRCEVSIEEMTRALDRSNARLASVIADPGPSPSAVMRHHEKSVVLADLLAQLPKQYRQVLTLRNVQGLPFAEVGDRMDRSAGAVRILWLRAVRQLRELLENQDQS